MIKNKNNNVFKTKQRQRYARELLNETDIGDTVTIKWHSNGSGLGNGYLELETTGTIKGIDGFNVIIKEKTNITTYIPLFWLDAVEKH